MTVIEDSGRQGSGPSGASVIENRLVVSLGPRDPNLPLSFERVRVINELGNDLLNGNANVQQGDVDVGAGNPLHVQGTVIVVFPASQTVDQAVHDLLNANANLQVGDVDVSAANPVPVIIVQNKQPFSSSTNGRPIAVGIASAPGTLIHTSIAANRDLVTMWATNTSATDRRLTLEMGGVGASDLMTVFCPLLETVIVLDEAPIQNALTIAAFLDAGASTVNLFGYFQREVV